MKIFLILFGIIALLIVGGIGYWQTQHPVAEITNFQECAAAGNPVLESYPAQCKTPDGKTFVQNIGNELEKQELIQITHPRPGQTIAHQIQITGQARGPWYFEASFPIRLEDAEKNSIATSFAQAQGEWMTEAFVPFSANLNIPASFHGAATLVLEKDNPSGLPEHADALYLPVTVE